MTRAGATRLDRTDDHGPLSRHPDEQGLAQRGDGALLVGLVIVTFLALAVGASIYDMGKWIGVW